MSIYHLLNTMHSYWKITNVFVAILPAAACILRSMNKCVVIELLVWLLICCVLIELLCRYWTNKKENCHISSMDLHGNEWYWRARANNDDENEKIKKRKRFKTRTRCKLVFVAIERLTLSNFNWIDDIDRDRGFHIQDCCFITFDLFRPDDENGGKWGQETAFIFGQIR